MIRAAVLSGLLDDLHQRLGGLDRGGHLAEDRLNRGGGLDDLREDLYLEMFHNKQMCVNIYIYIYVYIYIYIHTYV